MIPSVPPPPSPTRRLRPGEKTVDETKDAIAAIVASATVYDPKTGAPAEPIPLEEARVAVHGTKPYRQPRRSSSSQREAYRRELELAAEELDDTAAAAVANSAPKDSRPKRPRAPRPRPLAPKTERRIRYEHRLAREGARDCNPRDLPDHAFARVRTIVRGNRKQAEKSLAELPRCYALRVRRAALGIERRASGGWTKPVRDLGHIRAREIVAAGVLLFRLGLPTRRRGYARVVDGLSRGMLANAFVDPRTNERYSVQYLFATCFRRRDESEWWDCGAFVALERAGAIKKQQPPADQVPRAFVGPTGYAFNEYWLSAVACSPIVPELERDDASEGAELAGAPDVGPDPPPPS